jgi:hypothetical protein
MNGNKRIAATLYSVGTNISINTLHKVDDDDDDGDDGDDDDDGGDDDDDDDDDDDNNNKKRSCFLGTLQAKWVSRKQ